MKIPKALRFRMKSRVAHAERLAAIALGKEYSKCSLDINYDNLKASKVTGTSDPFIRERFLQYVLNVVGDKY